MKRRINLQVALVYIGNLPAYMRLFLKSCAHNPTVGWTLATSNEPEQNLPDNVRWTKLDLDEFKTRVGDLFGVKAQIPRPYKLCDFRPAYGSLYPEWFSGADFWGHCDADVVFGDLRKYFPDDFFEDHIKVQMRGALSFYKNDSQGNSIYKLPHPHIDYRQIFANPKYCGFDEWEGIFKVLRHNQIPYKLSNQIAEINYSRNDLTLTHRENYPLQVFSWENGRILRTAWQDGREISDEFSYIHLQKRRIAYVDVAEGEMFAFLPGKITGFSRSDEKKALAKLNRKSRIWEIKHHLGRIPRYLKSFNTIDRYYWRLQK